MIKPQMESRFIQSIQIRWDEIPRNSYLKSIPSLSKVKRVDFTTPITFFVGENGTGKSTLLEGIAVAYGFNAEGGTKNYRFSTFDDVSELGQAIHITKGFKKPRTGYFFRAESFFNVATKTEDYRDQPKEIYYARSGGRSFHEQSHGESFLALFQTFDPEGIYIMDEPEAAISPQRQMTLLIEIVQMAKKGAQFIIATHSPILLGTPGARILSFDGESLHECAYEETESYRITEMFINDRENIINKLLEASI